MLAVIIIGLVRLSQNISTDVAIVVYVCANIKHNQSLFKMCSMCSNTSSKTWMPLPDCFIDEHLVEMFSLVDQVRLQLMDLTNLAAMKTLLPLPPNLII